MSRKNKSKKKKWWTGIYDNDDSNEDYFICKNCGRKISGYDFYNHDGLCKYCRGIMIQKNFPPGPPGFPKF